MKMSSIFTPSRSNRTKPPKADCCHDGKRQKERLLKQALSQNVQLTAEAQPEAPLESSRLDHDDKTKGMTEIKDYGSLPGLRASRTFARMLVSDAAAIQTCGC